MAGVKNAYNDERSYEEKWVQGVTRRGLLAGRAATSQQPDYHRSEGERGECQSRQGDRIEPGQRRCRCHGNDQESPVDCGWWLEVHFRLRRRLVMEDTKMPPRGGGGIEGIPCSASGETDLGEQLYGKRARTASHVD